MLVASRTRTFESALPVLPLIFFCHSDPLYLSFPPSPAITLAVLPYLRGAYNSLWSRFISPYEDRWIKDVTPAYALENAETRQAANQNNINNQRRQENVNGQQGNRQAGENGELGAEAAVNGNRWDGEVHLENHNIIIQGSNITNMILGALLWPSVARMVGENVLGKWPKAWGGDVVRKLLPEGVVRNVVGGLMAVVLKVCHVFLLTASVPGSCTFLVPSVGFPNVGTRFAGRRETHTLGAARTTTVGNRLCFILFFLRRQESMTSDRTLIVLYVPSFQFPQLPRSMITLCCFFLRAPSR